jgi:peptide/nickel transport system substrate-binding protein
LLPSGSGAIRIKMESTNTKADFPTMGGAIVRNWQQIGILATSDVVDGGLASQRAQANKIVATVNNVYGVEEPFLTPSGFLPVTSGGVVGSTMGYRYSSWFLSGGKEGTEPPDSLKLLKDAVTLYNQGAALPREKRTEIGRQIFQMHADQVWTIGVVGFSPSSQGLIAARNTLGNVPARISNTQQQSDTTIALPQTLYFT